MAKPLQRQQPHSDRWKKRKIFLQFLGILAQVSPAVTHCVNEHSQCHWVTLSTQKALNSTQWSHIASLLWALIRVSPLTERRGEQEDTDAGFTARYYWIKSLFVVFLCHPFFSRLYLSRSCSTLTWGIHLETQGSNSSAIPAPQRQSWNAFTQHLLRGPFTAFIIWNRNLAPRGGSRYTHAKPQVLPHYSYWPPN